MYKVSKQQNPHNLVPVTTSPAGGTTEGITECKERMDCINTQHKWCLQRSAGKEAV